MEAGAGSEGEGEAESIKVCLAHRPAPRDESDC